MRENVAYFPSYRRLRVMAGPLDWLAFGGSSTMSSIATNAVRLEPTMVGQDNPFMVSSQLEITHILHAILRDGALITVTVDANDFFLTSLLAIDDSENCMYLERGHASPHSSRALRGRPLSFDTTLEKVQIRFCSVGIEAMEYDGKAAYRIPLPAEMLRIQRREFYRVSTPIAVPLKCRLSVGKNAADGAVELTICDISCGGIAVRSPPALFAPELGTFYSCSILLPGTSGLRIKVQARNAFMVTLLNGKIAQRCGFVFVDPAESMLATVQRYILNLERLQRTRGRREG